ncbi:MAG: M20 family peptidase [Myxococcales bacterium]|nr:M20 family peptidase [Myxococcales bacterium]
MAGRGKRIGVAFAVVVLVLVAILLGRTLMFRSVQIEAPPPAPTVEAGPVARRLSAAVQFATVSGPHGNGAEPFLALHAWLQTTYPRFHAVAEREVIGERSLLYTWKGSDASRPPVLFLAHMDVVPVEAGTESAWTKPPFSGAIVPCGDLPGDCVWGRGTLDMKAGLIGLLEAAEALAASGEAPARTLVFAFGADEEVGGKEGAVRIAAVLKSRGLRFEWAIDEGLVITDGIVPGAPRPVALIGIAEKGYVSLSLTAHGEGGHSSMPPPMTAVGRISRAVARLEADPFPADIDGAVATMLDRIGPEMPFGMRLGLSNRWLLGGLITSQFTHSNQTNATLRTTQAATVFHAGEQDNVLPQQARAVINYRIHPRDSVARVIERVTRVIDDPEVQIEALPNASEPSPLASVDGPGYRLIERAIRAAAPEAIVAPGLMVGATDTRHYLDLVDAVYRFNPLHVRPGDGERFHGTNERVVAADLAVGVSFYLDLVRAAAR